MKTQEQIESVISTEEYFKAGQKTTVCILTLKNGFEVVGASACIDPKDYNAEIGRKYSRENAVNKIWELEAYMEQDAKYRFDSLIQATQDAKPDIS